MWNVLDYAPRKDISQIRWIGREMVTGAIVEASESVERGVHLKRCKVLFDVVNFEAPRRIQTHFFEFWAIVQ